MALRGVTGTGICPPCKVSLGETAGNVTNPYSENRRFSEWVDPDRITKKDRHPQGVPIFFW